VERICDRIALLRGGELVLMSTVAEVRKLAPRRVTIVFRQDVAALPTLSGNHRVVVQSPRRWQLEVEGPLGDLVSALSGLPIEDLQIEQPRLEDVLVKYYEGERK
jgi:ABC-2 type transport system ATP-binding protein